MIRVEGGVLLPQSLLGQDWFHTFALFVAFNTIIYVGLTLSKFVPWPEQIHPSRVRDLMPGVTKESTMRDVSRSTRNDPKGAFADGRLSAAAASIPLALSLIAGLAIVVVTLQLVFVASTVDINHVVVYALALLMLVWAQVCAHSPIKPSTVVWSWCALTCLLVLTLARDALIFDNPVTMTYAVMVFIIMPIVAVAWQPSLVAGVIGLVGITVGGLAVDALNSLQWSLAALASFAMGLLVLEVRRSGLDSVTLERMKAEYSATHDPLTGLLTRSALIALAEGVTATAGSVGEPVHAVMIDINGMTRTNTDYGDAYGDVVIASVARSIERASSKGDLAARWDGDRFLLLGVGAPPDAEDLRKAVDDSVSSSGVALGKRPITVSIGVAAMDSAHASLDAMVQHAAGGLAGATS